jgi:hypothetical protein
VISLALLVASFTMMVLSGCGQVVIRDHELCGDEGSLGAECYHTLTPDHRVIHKSQWDDERFGMICTSADNVADDKAAIEKLCNETKKCTTDQQVQLQRASKFLNRIKAKTNK